MQTTGEDYYDIPDDELPSANFAARPTSEISEISLRICMSVVSFSSGDIDSELDIDGGPTPTALAPGALLMPQPEMPDTPPDTPNIIVNASSRRQSLRQRLKSLNDVASIMRKPSLRQKVDSAPPGAFSLAEYAPQVPRRAVSARLEKRDAARGRYSRHLSAESDSKARRVLGVDERLWEEEESEPANSAEEIEGVERDQEMGLPQPHASFSRKPRVRETLEKKQLTRLRMDFVSSEPKMFVDSPQSMLGTPLELYAIPGRQPGRFRPTSAINGRRGSSTPVSPRTPSPFRRPQLRLNHRVAGDENLEDSYQTRAYVPGPVCLEEHPALLRNYSVATLDPFVSEIDSIGRRPSDLQALEQIVVYFDDMGLIEEATDKCLDKYWLSEQQQAPQEPESGVMEPVPLRPRSQQRKRSSKDPSSMLSRFSLSPASSDASVPQSSPQKRQLLKLRKLLSPALPGSKGAES
ncbi:uncharacterized protein EKO05_0002329 [Ascochyta rabiei]|uniref:Uncharacterized protein n=1 Tax=Didymella rabiei TaxID=5454 RepID=A0A162VLD9_DIDRA|nr:uncharacterized protein EKO05_0002329 [Ascochyta rabiei]KZM18521.1 hypothetical protein ST47_g10333 [Ascochyta rabiei]UPX11738.1 hypothetical protein EKO05_0002329 [Ascochyta rabiei]